MDIQTTLQSVFGFDSFLEGQEAVIRRVVDGRSVLAIFPTGRGKSLCYQLSALHLPGMTLVVSPLVALMKDQVDFLQKSGIRATRLDSSLDLETFRLVNRDLTSGKLKLFYVAPERFANERFLEKIRRLPISLMVIDEAHCISEWGHNFRPDYLKLAGLFRDLRIPTVLALTATAIPRVADEIRSAFGIQADDYIHTGFYRPNLTLRFTPCSTEKPPAMLMERLKSRPEAPAIVYVTLQATAEQVAETLRSHGFEARPYHAGLNDETRHAVQEWFMESDHAIVVATIAFGMGIDKADIRYVYHYNLPKSLENYAQETGRAGRNGEEAICEMLGNPDDLTLLENFIYGDTPEREAVTSLIDEVLQQEERFSLSVYELSYTYDTRPLVVSTLLTYLELEGVIESTGPFYVTYQFKPLRSSKEILERFDADRAEFLRSLFSSAVKGRTWFTLEADEAADKLDTTRERIVAALTYLEEQNDLELQVKGARQGYRLKRRLPEEEFARLKQNLVERFHRSEKRDIKRLQEVVHLINHSGCKVNYLLAYFGENRSENCGHCESCLNDAAAAGTTLPERRTTTLSAAQQEQVTTILAEHHKALTTIRQQARFFCGIRSPKIVRAKLTGHPTFGALARVPFAHVHDWLKEKR